MLSLTLTLIVLFQNASILKVINWLWSNVYEELLICISSSTQKSGVCDVPDSCVNSFWQYKWGYIYRSAMTFSSDICINLSKAAQFGFLFHFPSVMICSTFENSISFQLHLSVLHIRRRLVFVIYKVSLGFSLHYNSKCLV